MLAAKMKSLLGLIFLAIGLHHAKAEPPPAADPRAARSAEILLEAVGGRSLWSARVLVVQERAFLRSGATANIEIARDFVAGARVVKATTNDGSKRVEIVAPSSGWTIRDGVVSRLEPETLASELEGLRQEPYYIYHRLARGGAGLRMALKHEGRTLEVSDTRGKVLCWFHHDGKGAPIGWGNIFEGAKVEHFYGPYIPLGGGFFPKWGAAYDGSWRLEYLAAEFSNNPLEIPGVPSP